MRPPPGWDNNQPYPDYDWNNEDNGAQGTTPATPVVPTSPPTTAETHPTFQPRPPTPPTKDTLIIGNNTPPQVPDPYEVKPTLAPVSLPYHSIEESEERPIIFPSSSKYVHLPNQEVRSEPIDVRRR